MNHELCMELKAAGFPQKGNRISTPHRTYICTGDDDCYCPRCTDTPPYAVEPTLSELILACGDGFDYLFNQKHVPNSKGKWVACRDRYQSLEDCFFADTPEEAVARLWLALQANKKS